MAYGNNLQQKIYFKAPYPLKNVMSSLYGYKQARERYGRYYQRWLDLLEESQWFDSDLLKEFQLENTRNFLVHAYYTTRHYKDLFNKLGWSPSRMSSLEELQRLPLLKKSTIRNNPSDFITTGFDSSRFIWAHTSGTTGQALVFPLSREAFQREHAFRHIHYSWSGVGFKPRVAVCAGHPVAHINRSHPPFWTHDYYNNWLLLSSYHLAAQNLDAYIGKLARFRPDIIKGYPSSVYILALAHKKSAHRVRPRAVYTASETLFPHQRQAIEESFQCKVFNWYGTSEMCVNAVECDQGNMHLKAEHSYIEILKEDGTPARSGERGRVICTAFGNYALPFVRYDVGDIAVPAGDERCSCGRGGRIIQSIEGRREDYIITPEGRWVGRLDHIFKDSVNVIEAQIYQDSVDSMEIRMVVSGNFNEDDEQSVLKEARNRLGHSIRIHCKYVPRIERTKNGKFRFIVSELDQEIVMNELAKNNKDII